MNLGSLALAGGAAAIVVVAWRSAAPDVDVTSRSVFAKTSSIAGVESRLVLAANSPPWQRSLRRPLYDPPPPPAPKIEVQVRPITIKLVGTVLEPQNSQAFVRQASGAVELKRIGDLATGEKADGVISEITPSEIVIRRDDGEHRVPVEGRN